MKFIRYSISSSESADSLDGIQGQDDLDTTLVQRVNHWFRYFSASTLTPDGITVVAPSYITPPAPGRWIRQGAPAIVGNRSQFPVLPFGVFEGVHFVYSTADLPAPVNRERILTDGVWIFMANVSDAAFDGGGNPDPTAANSLVIPAGGKVELVSGQLSFQTTTSMWGYRTNSDRPALRIAQAATHAMPFFVWNQEHSPGAPSVSTDTGVAVTLCSWFMGLASGGPVEFNGATNLSNCGISDTVAFAQGTFLRMDNCQHGAISLLGTGGDDNWGIEFDNCRMNQGAPGAFLTIPAGVGIRAGGGVTMSNCHMPVGSGSRLVDFGADFNKSGFPYLSIDNCTGGSPSLGVVPSGGVSINAFRRLTADGGFVGFTEATAKVYVRESFAEDGTKLPETAI